MTKGKRCISVIVSTAMIGTLFTGCGLADKMTDKMTSMITDSVDVTETISKKSKWINSDIAGAVTEDTNVSEKDDFSTAVNKEWLLSMKDKAEKEGSVSRIENNIAVVIQQKQDLIKRAVSGEEFEPNKVGMNEQDYEHLCEIFSSFTNMAADWEQRNAEGTEPLRKYISEIESVDSIDGMNQYLCNKDGQMFSDIYLLPFEVTPPLDETDGYTVAVTSSFAVSTASETESDGAQMVYVMETVTDILQDMGYSSAEAKKIVKRCWQMENSLSECTAMEEMSGSADIEDQLNNRYTKEDLKELAGDYPLFDILETYGLDNSDQYTVYEPVYVEGVAKLYSEKNLEKIKSYYIVNTILQAMPLLSRDYYDQYMEYFSSSASSDEEEETDDTEQDPEKPDDESVLSKEDEILQGFVTGYMNDVLEEMYITNYCSTEQKEYLQDVIQDAIGVYEKMLGSEEWMSAETMQKAIEKLKYITPRVLYPDRLNGYEQLQLDAENLVDAVAELNTYYLKKDAEKVNTKTDKTEWDLRARPTTEVNAYYNPSDNSIIILAGITANKELFDINASYEENLGHIGFIIGHEISHAFDTQGYQYDKDGNQKMWWTKQDEQKFQAKAGKLADYFSTFSSLRGSSSNVDGDKVKAEAIADMGGAKCMIALGKQQSDFDYQKFFRAYAQTFAAVRSLMMEMMAQNEDEHPLPFLRTNVTVQQFEEFYEAFDIQPGDGMYLAPEKRVAVW